MRKILSLLSAVIFLALPMAAQAGERPVVVELFTSQGCSSCPPADAYLHKLAKRDDVIALAMHVDYWDYIGWKDSFASPALTQRQRDYARRGNRRMVYTPQMIINGEDHVVGNRPRDVEELISRHSKADTAVDLIVSRDGNQVSVTATPVQALLGSFSVQLVHYKPSQTVDIKRGENKGRSLSYANVVTRIDVLRNWDGRAPLEITAKMTGDQPGIILVQGADHGPVLAAAKIN